MKKAILFLEQQSWLSGAQRVLENVLDSIIPEFEPLVAFPSPGPFSAKLQARNIETLLMPLGAYRSGRKSHSEMLAFSARSLLSGLKLASVVRRRNVGLIYINGPRCLPAGVLAACLTGRPSLFHLHLTLTRKPEISLVAHLARYVSKIVTCSIASAQPLLDADPQLAGKIHLFHQPVLACGRPPHLFAKAAGPPTRFTLGMVGRITEHKGQGRLLSAVGMLRPDLQEKTHMVFVGAPAPGDLSDVAYAYKLKDTAAQLHLHDRIFWAGYQTDPVAFYGSMDMLVQPSSVQSGEAMPLAILEALREGVPVLASRTGGIPEIIQPEVNGLLVPPGDDGALAGALQRFLVDGPLRARLQSGARSTLLDQFSVERFQSKIHGLIRELSSCNPPEEGGSQRRELTAWK